MRTKTRQAAIALGLIAFAVATFYWQVWSFNPEERAWFEGDIFEKDYPARAAWVRLVCSGHFPFWNPYEFGGWPALANCEAGVLYPLNWLLVAVAGDGFLKFYQLEGLILLHFVLAGWFMYLLIRQYGLGFGPAMLAALLYAFCGFHGGHKLHVNLFSAAIWLPLILLFVERGLKREGLYDFLWASLFLGIAYLAGHPQMAYYISALVAVRLLWELPADRKREAGWAGALEAFLRRAAPLYLLAGGLAAVQWIPSLELFDLTRRGGERSYAFASEYSLPPQELVEFLLPQTFGWYFIEVFYVGIWAWLLAWAAIGRNPYLKPGEAPGARAGLFWFAVLGGALLLALGSFSGLLPSLYPWLPGLGKMRAPSRMLYFVNVGLAILAAVGLQRLLEPGEEGLKLAGRLQRLTRGALLIAALALIYLYSETLKPYPQVHLENLKGMAEAVVLIGVYLGLGWLLLRLYCEGRISPAALTICFCLLVFVDVATYNNKINVVTRKIAYEASPATDLLRAEQQRGGRFRYLQPDGQRTRANGNVFGLEEASGSSPLAPAKYFYSLEKARRNPNLARLMGIRYLAGEVPDQMKDIASPAGSSLWQLPGAFPRVFMVADTVVVRQSAVREALQDSEAWDYARLAWVNRPVGAGMFRPGLLGPDKTRFPVPVLIYSAGKEALRIGAYILVDGLQACPGGRGYNLVVLHPASGKVEKTGTFDTLENLDASRAMAEFIASASEGSLILGAVCDEGTIQLTSEAVEALRSVGCAAEVAGKYRLAHAFAGVKGSAPGSAIEAVSSKEAILALGSQGGQFIAMTTESQKTDPGKAELLGWEPGWLKAKAEGEGVLIIAENHYPGWTARLQGQELDVVEADTLFLAVSPGAEGGEVKLRFRPTGWYFGLALSILSLGVIVAGLWLSRPRGGGSSFRRSDKNQLKSFILET